MIYENYLNSGLSKYVKFLKNRFYNVNIYGIMQVQADKYLTNEESIVIVKNKLISKYNKIKDKDNIMDKLIEEKYNDKESIKEIKKILDIILNFNK